LKVSKTYRSLPLFYRGGFLVLLVFWFGCAGIAPYENYAQAKMAIVSAEAIGAKLDAPITYQKAVKHLKLSERAFFERFYAEARSQALQARDLAETAEVETLKKRKNGGSIIENLD